jgi:hypothetical protein
MSQLRGSSEDVKIFLGIEGVGSRDARYDEDRPTVD